MKKLILFTFLILLLSSATFSQPYHSLFAKDTTLWSVAQITGDLEETVVYYSVSDTIIKEKPYHTIYHEISDYGIDLFGSGATICGFIREDTINGKYWFLNSGVDTALEVILMDLSLNKGDTFTFIEDYRYQWKDSVRVDSVFYENNRKILELDKTHFDGFNVSKVWFIEGIGPTTGFFMAEELEQPVFFGLLCKFDNNNHIYSSPSADLLETCFYTGGGDVKKIKPDNWVDIYPNPSTSKINIQLKNLSYLNCQLYLFNSTGSLILRRPMLSENDYLDVSQNGIYFLKVESGNIILNKKIVVVGN